MKRATSLELLPAEWLSGTYFCDPVRAWFDPIYAAQGLGRWEAQFTTDRSKEASRIAAETRARMMEHGTADQKFAAKGTLAGVFSAPINDRAPAMQSKRKPFKFQPNSLAERVYAVLPADGSPALGTELWRRFNVTSKVLSKTLEPAIRASVVVRVRVGGSHAARFARGKVAPELAIPTL